MKCLSVLSGKNKGYQDSEECPNKTKKSLFHKNERESASEEEDSLLNQL